MEGDAFFQACRDKMRKGTRRFVSPVPVGARIRKILRFINICTARPANISKSIWTMRPCVPFRRARRYRGQTTREPRDSSFFSLSLSLPLPFPRHFSPGIVASRVKSRNNEKEERGGRMRWEGGKGRRANEGEKKKKKRKKRKIIERASLPVSSLSLSLSLFPCNSVPASRFENYLGANRACCKPPLFLLAISLPAPSSSTFRSRFVPLRLLRATAPPPPVHLFFSSCLPFGFHGAVYVRQPRALLRRNTCVQLLIFVFFHRARTEIFKGRYVSRDGHGLFARELRDEWRNRGGRGEG